MVADIKQKYISCSVVRFTSVNSNSVLVDVSVTGEDGVFMLLLSCPKKDFTESQPNYS